MSLLPIRRLMRFGVLFRAIHVVPLTPFVPELIAPSLQNKMAVFPSAQSSSCSPESKRVPIPGGWGGASSCHGGEKKLSATRVSKLLGVGTPRRLLIVRGDQHSKAQSKYNNVRHITSIRAAILF